LAFDASAAPRSMSSATCIRAPALLQSARTDRLGHPSRPAKKRNAYSALWLMAKTPPTSALWRRFRLPTRSAKLPISTSSSQAEAAAPNSLGDGAVPAGHLETAASGSRDPRPPPPCRRSHCRDCTDHGAITAARARAALSARFNWAIREGLDIEANPLLGTNRPGRTAVTRTGLDG